MTLSKLPPPSKHGFTNPIPPRSPSPSPITASFKRIPKTSSSGCSPPSVCMHPDGKPFISSSPRITLPGSLCSPRALLPPSLRFPCISTTWAGEAVSSRSVSISPRRINLPHWRIQGQTMSRGKTSSSTGHVSHRSHSRMTYMKREAGVPLSRVIFRPWHSVKTSRSSQSG